MSLYRSVHPTRIGRGVRYYASSGQHKSFKILVVGGGSAGLSVANQLYDRFRVGGSPLQPDDIAICDSNDYHYYQPGWYVVWIYATKCYQLFSFRTLVGAGLKQKDTTRKPLASLIPKHITHIPENVSTFDPKSSSVTTTEGSTIRYDALVVAAGLQTNWDQIKGLGPALIDSSSGVSSIYSYETADKVWADIDSLRSGNACENPRESE